MTTHFITAEIELESTPAQLHKAIEEKLQQHGEPLRWAVTSVDASQQTAVIEAVVTQEATAWACNTPTLLF